MFCTNCGSAVHDGQKFCGECGATQGGERADMPAPERHQDANASAEVMAVGWNSKTALEKLGYVALLAVGFVAIGYGIVSKWEARGGHTLTPIVDNSPVLHYTEKMGIMGDLMQLRMSLPETTYAQFDSAASSVDNFCLMAQRTNDATNGSNPNIYETCLKANFDRHTVNQIISLGEKLDDSSLSLNDRMLIVIDRTNTALKAQLSRR